MKATLPGAGTIGALILLGLAGCSSAPHPGAAAPVTRMSPPQPRPQPEAVSPGFAEWLAGFRARALAAGIRPAVIDAALAGVTPDPEVLERDRFQPEFRRQIWEYLDRAVSDRRVATGREMLARHGPLLAAIEARFGVDRQILLAIWGLESNFSAATGEMDVLRSLATLAHEGRRRDFAEAQLIAALRIIQDGHVPPHRLRGSWAGAMGHTQFIPTSFLEYAVDWNGDGRIDIWSDDPGDALASTANYLARFGWTPGLPWGVEVMLPAGFDLALADGETWREAPEWAAAGLRRADGTPLGALGRIALIAPAGGRGPVFAITGNFRVIRRYNNATAYALAVGHLGDRILGGGPFLAPWPRDEAALSVAETVELQERLTAAGFDTLGADGMVGPNTVRAIRAYQRARGLPPDGFPTRALLVRLQTGG
ncbi:MAG: murein transglycosylase [Paracoccaceae bacterium]|nr:MAG: murein transglycosylase [Paracoccaceae bacterium]